MRISEIEINEIITYLINALESSKKECYPNCEGMTHENITQALNILKKIDKRMRK